MLIDIYSRVATDLRGLAHRPVQPSPHALRGGRGPAVAGQVRPAHGRRGRTAGPGRCAALAPRPRLWLTTDGIGPWRTTEALERAGPGRVPNVSPDTLRPAVFKALTRRGRHHDVLESLAAARAAGPAPVKLNAVLMPGVNDDEAPEPSWRA